MTLDRVMPPAAVLFPNDPVRRTMPVNNLLRSYSRDAVLDAAVGVLLGLFSLAISVGVLLVEPTPGQLGASEATLMAGASIVLLLVAGGHLLVGRPPGWLVSLAIGADLLLYWGLTTRVMPFFADLRNLMTPTGVLFLIGIYWFLAAVWKLTRVGTR